MISLENLTSFLISRNYYIWNGHLFSPTPQFPGDEFFLISETSSETFERFCVFWARWEPAKFLASGTFRATSGFCEDELVHCSKILNRPLEKQRGLAHGRIPHGDEVNLALRWLKQWCPSRIRPVFLNLLSDLLIHDRGGSHGDDAVGYLWSLCTVSYGSCIVYSAQYNSRVKQ